jgi:hypothetical protein
MNPENVAVPQTCAIVKQPSFGHRMIEEPAIKLAGRLNIYHPSPVFR